MEHRWGGRLCLSWHGDPAFGEVEEGIFSACCQNGLGASTGILNGMLAADLATGRDNPYVDQFLAMNEPTRLPPEPLSSIGATVYLNWKEWRAGTRKMIVTVQVWPVFEVTNDGANLLLEKIGYSSFIIEVFVIEPPPVGL